jgi:hypothetical protein
VRRVLIEAVPEPQAGAAGDALVRALCTTPGILPDALFGGEQPALMALTSGAPNSRSTVTVSSRQATPQEIIAAADRMIDALKNLRINIASDMVQKEVKAGKRKSLN